MQTVYLLLFPALRIYTRSYQAVDCGSMMLNTGIIIYSDLTSHIQNFYMHGMIVHGNLSIWGLVQYCYCGLILIS